MSTLGLNVPSFLSFPLFPSFSETVPYLKGILSFPFLFEGIPRNSSDSLDSLPSSSKERKPEEKEFGS